MTRKRVEVKPAPLPSHIVGDATLHAGARVYRLYSTVINIAADDAAPHMPIVISGGTMADLKKMFWIHHPNGFFDPLLVYESVLVHPDNVTVKEIAYDPEDDEL